MTSFATPAIRPPKARRMEFDPEDGTAGVVGPVVGPRPTPMMVPYDTGAVQSQPQDDGGLWGTDPGRSGVNTGPEQEVDATTDPGRQFITDPPVTPPPTAPPTAPPGGGPFGLPPGIDRYNTGPANSRYFEAMQRPSWDQWSRRRARPDPRRAATTRSRAPAS